MRITGSNLKRKTIVYNKIVINIIEHKFFVVTQSDYAQKIPEILSQARQEVQNKRIADYEKYKNVEYLRDIYKNILKADITDGDIQRTDAYKNAYTVMTYKYVDKEIMLESIGKYLKYMSYLTGPLGLVFLLAGLFKSDD
ncbi:MAG: hypothetical protein ABSB79_13195 [Syntrophales bacterium]|jgi:hypothetical protein